jgi:hypothetical protein
MCTISKDDMGWVKFLVRERKNERGNENALFGYIFPLGRGQGLPFALKQSNAVP